MKVILPVYWRALIDVALKAYLVASITDKSFRSRLIPATSNILSGIGRR